LDVAPSRAGDRTRCRTRERNEHCCKCPKEEELLDCGVRQSGHPREREEEPRADRHEVEDARDLVGGGVVRMSVVVAVEAVEPTGEDPCRQRRREQDPLEAEVEGAAASTTEDQLRQKEGGQ